MIQDIFPHVYHNEINGKFRIKRILFFATVKNIYYIVRRRTTGSICRAWRIFRRCASSCNICFPLTSGPTIWPRARLRRARAGKRCRPGSCGASRAGRASSRRLRARASYRWYSSQRFCGRCGARMGKSKVERAMVCPACGNTVLSEDLPGGHRRGA